MEVNEEDGQEKQVNRPLLNSPCSAFHKIIQAILKCLGLEPPSSSSSSSSPSLLEKEEGDTSSSSETGEETGFMGMVLRLVKRKRKPRPGYSSGDPGQIN